MALTRHIFLLLISFIVFSHASSTASSIKQKVPLEKRIVMCNTALFKTFLRTMYEVSPLAFDEGQFKKQLWEIRNAICQKIVDSDATNGSLINIEALESRCRQFCKDFGPFYSDFEWKCSKLWDLVFLPLYEKPRTSSMRFLGLNEDVYVVNNFNVGNPFRVLLLLAMNTRHPPKNSYASLLLAADHEALMANILMFHRLGGQFKMHRAAHDYFLGNIYSTPTIDESTEVSLIGDLGEDADEVILNSLEERLNVDIPARPQLQPRLCISKAPYEERDQDNMPVHVFGKFANQVKLVIIGACAVSAILNFLY